MFESFKNHFHHLLSTIKRQRVLPVTQKSTFIRKEAKNSANRKYQKSTKIRLQ